MFKLLLQLLACCVPIRQRDDAPSLEKHDFGHRDLILCVPRIHDTHVVEVGVNLARFLHLLQRIEKIERIGRSFDEQCLLCNQEVVA